MKKVRPGDMYLDYDATVYVIVSVCDPRSQILGVPEPKRLSVLKDGKLIQRHVSTVQQGACLGTLTV